MIPWVFSIKNFATLLRLLDLAFQFNFEKNIFIDCSFISLRALIDRPVSIMTQTRNFQKSDLFLIRPISFFFLNITTFVLIFYLSHHILFLLLNVNVCVRLFFLFLCVYFLDSRKNHQVKFEIDDAIFFFFRFFFYVEL